MIREEHERRQNIVLELECMDTDFDKALFLIGEITDAIDVKSPKSEADAYGLHECMERIDSLAGIVRDYISRVQSCISDIVIRERQKDK